jgi:tetratricopeptide (TPR) repeat protein
MTPRHAALLLALLASACATPTKPAAPPPPVPAATALPPDADASEEAIRFLEDKAKSDPQDFIARNQLAGRYLARLRETGNLDYLRLAAQAARESLAAIPAEQNVGGLAALAQVEFASHEFAAARDHARQLRDYDPKKLYPLTLLGDALLELGDYDGAAEAFREMERRASDSDSGTLNVETRLARLALLRGDTGEAKRRFATALEAALALDPAPRETVAWCYWQLGEVAFMTGDYDEAERRARDSLTTFPGYYRALGALGRALAAKGDTAGAIEQYERVTRTLPDPVFVAALGDLYAVAGRDKEAAAQYQLVTQIGRLSELNGALYNRQLALFWADHDLEPEAAYAAAAREYEVRKDVYGADAVAWTALKAGKIDEAKAAVKEALRLGTEDARLFYHAGLIAKAAGDAAGARTYLERALALSPQFDPLQSRHAREALG